jgi:hypothetical protein
MNRSKRGLIRIYLYIFKNTLSNVKILDKNIKSTILKKQKKMKKTETTEKKAEEVAGLRFTHIIFHDSEKTTNLN